MFILIHYLHQLSIRSKRKRVFARQDHNYHENYRARTSLRVKWNDK